MFIKNLSHTTQCNTNDRTKTTLNFMAKLPKSSLKTIKISTKVNVDEFFSNPDNIKMIEENKKYSQKVTEYVARHSPVSEEVMNKPFGPAPGIEW